MKKIFRIFRFVPVLVCLPFLTGCLYYKAVSCNNDGSKPRKFAHALHKLQQPEKYIIVHCGDLSWHLADVKADSVGYNNETNRKYVISLKGRLEIPDTEYKIRTTALAEGDLARYTAWNKNYALSQVHLYLNSKTSCKADYLSIPVASIISITVYGKAKGPTIVACSIPVVVLGIITAIGISDVGTSMGTGAGYF